MGLQMRVFRSFPTTYTVTNTNKVYSMILRRHLPACTVVHDIHTWWIIVILIYWENPISPIGAPCWRKMVLRLKKINPMSQSCRVHLFFGVRLIQQNSRFEFFCLLNFFFQFFMNWLSKYTRKDMTDTLKHFQQQTFFNSVFCLVSCSSKNQVPYF